MRKLKLSLFAAVAMTALFALFEGELLSLGGFIVDSAVLIVIGLLSYRLTLTRKMVTQYPWIYERAGLFGWREKGRT